MIELRVLSQWNIIAIESTQSTINGHKIQLNSNEMNRIIARNNVIGVTRTIKRRRRRRRSKKIKIINNDNKK